MARHMFYVCEGWCVCVLLILNRMCLAVPLKMGDWLLILPFGSDSEKGG